MRSEETQPFAPKQRGGGTGENRRAPPGTQRWYGQNGRLFVYYTANDYASGCYNTDCGFVQTDNSVYLDADWANYSASGGTQYDIFMGLFKDSSTGDWWVRFGDGSGWVGYWPRSLFNSSGIADTATYMAFGGEVYDNDSSAHTGTDMGGDGSFPSVATWEHSAYQHSLRYYTYVGGGSFYWSNIDALTNSPQMENSNCYAESYTTGDPNWFDYTYIGGGGRSGSCP